MNLELLETKINRVSSILHLLSSDIENPAGACVESVQINVLECAFDQLSYGIDMLEDCY